MKASWTIMEQSGMNCRLMLFSPDQAEDIGRALDHRGRTPAAIVGGKSGEPLGRSETL